MLTTLHSDIFYAKLIEEIGALLRHWHRQIVPGNTLSQLRIVRTHLNGTEAGAETGVESDVPRTVKSLLYNAISRLQTESPRQALVLEWRFLNGRTVNETCHRVNLSEPAIYKEQRKAIARLAAILIELEQEARKEHAVQLQHHLEAPTYSQLVGAEAHIDLLLQKLNASAAPWLIAIEGYGGLGKTALAHALAQRFINNGNIEGLAWVTARQSFFDVDSGIRNINQPVLTADALITELVSQLTDGDPLRTAQSVDQQRSWLCQRLNETPHLLVVDNLETAEDVVELMPLLHQLANPTKVLLTSRESIPGPMNVFHFRIPELNESHALALVRQEAVAANIDYLAQASDTNLRPIYKTVGGNPLALRLVVGQVYAHGLQPVLDDLAAARGQRVEELYKHIYWRAWKNLDEIARRVWLVMPLYTNNQIHADTLTAATALPLVDVRSGLERLIRFNLVNSCGGLNNRTYTIHNLTRTFLQEQVAQW